MARMRGIRGGVLKVVLIVVGVLALLTVCAGIYTALHWKGWVAQASMKASQQLINDSGLPDDQKQSILSEVKNLGDDFSSGKISNQEMARIVRSISDSPLLPLAGVQNARAKYIEPSDMTPKEKASAILALQRLARGVYEKKISTDDVHVVAASILDSPANRGWRLKEHPSRMDLDALVVAARARADKAEIPNEPFDLNIADELKKAIHGVS